ncbi:MAG: hypothetical protein PHW60_09400 [Kiritimatiellae bacterium]|nr:hypothetical protein [Kiritimatiellia bacterium]
MNRTWIWLILGGTAMGWLMCAIGQPPPQVGIFIDRRSGDMTGISSTLHWNV